MCLHSSSQLPPAQSRALNRECVLFDFYDTHDVWHFTSALSLFLSFTLMLKLDDDIRQKPRNQIPVF